MPPCIRCPRSGGSHQSIVIPFGTEKLEWWGHPMVKKLWGYVQSFRHNTGVWRTDRCRWTDILLRHSPRYASVSHGNHWSKISVHGDVCLNMETDVNHSEFGQENMVDGTFLQMHIQVQPESILSFYIAKHSILERMCSQLAPLVCVILFLHYNF